MELQTRLYRLASNFLVLRDNPILNHLPRLVVKWVNNIYICAVGIFFTRHKKKIALFTVREPKAVDDKAVIQGYARVRLYTIIAVTKTNLDAPDFDSVSSIVQCSTRRSVINAGDFSPAKLRTK